MDLPQHDLLADLFSAATSAASAAVCLPGTLPSVPPGRTVVVGAGKAAAAMAAAVERLWDGPLSGLVVTRYGHGVPCRRIRVVEAGHPLPDAAGLEAAALTLGLVRDLNADDLVLCLLSGGGSALLASPAAGLTLEHKQTVGTSLLRSGATIAEVNCVRKHLSAVKGGRLGAACAPARLVTLMLSDVPGDDPSVIASGPTVADPTTFAQALAVLAHHCVRVPEAVRGHLEAGARGEVEETPKPGDPRLAGSTAILAATTGDALEAAARRARERGLAPIVLGGDVEGEARAVAAIQADMARRHAADAGGASGILAVGLPCVLLSGGETTVTVRGRGRGGRNTEFLLALALELDGHPGIHALAADTDGIDGTEDNAGAFIDPGTLLRARAAGLDPHALLADNDSYSFFAALGDLLVTGPTRTNVNDFRAILITPEAARSPTQSGPL